jgi:RNA polymerase sigma-70 factor (ECF subfamily)
MTTWLHAIAARKASDLMRRKARYRRQDVAARELAAARAGAERAPDSDTDHEWVRSALARLPERQRVVVTLIYFGEQSPAQVAEALEVTESTVRCHLMHAHRSLRRWLSEEEAR